MFILANRVQDPGNTYFFWVPGPGQKTSDPGSCPGLRNFFVPENNKRRGFHPGYLDLSPGWDAEFVGFFNC